MSILILAEHNNLEVKSSTLNTISAASKVGSEIDVLVVGADIENIAKEIANYQHVSKVISLDDKNFEHPVLIKKRDMRDVEKEFSFKDKNFKASRFLARKINNNRVFVSKRISKKTGDY